MREQMPAPIRSDCRAGRIVLDQWTSPPALSVVQGPQREQHWKMPQALGQDGQHAEIAIVDVSRGDRGVSLGPSCDSRASRLTVARAVADPTCERYPLARAIEASCERLPSHSLTQSPCPAGRSLLMSPMSPQSYSYTPACAVSPAAASLRVRSPIPATPMSGSLTVPAGRLRMKV